MVSPLTAHPAPVTRLAVVVLLSATAIGAPALASVEPLPKCAEDFVSPAVRSYVAGEGTVYPQMAYATTSEPDLIRLARAALPTSMNLDAIHVLSTDTFLFSVDRNGVVATPDGPKTLLHNNVYRMELGSQPGRITPELLWQREGLVITSLDGVHKLPDGRYWFSTSATQRVTDGAATFWLRPWEVYEFNRSATPRLRRVLDAGALGFDDVVALSRVSGSDLRISPRTTRFVRVDGRMLRLLPHNAYRVDPRAPGVPELVFDGVAHGLPAINAYSTGDGLSCDDGRPETSWSVCERETCLGFQPGPLVRVAEISRRHLAQPLIRAPLEALALRVVRVPAYDGDRLVARAEEPQGITGSPYEVALAVTEALEMAGTLDPESEFTEDRSMVRRLMESLIAYTEGEPLDDELERALRLTLPGLLPLPPAGPAERAEAQALAERILGIDENDVYEYAARYRTMYFFRQAVSGVPIDTSMILVIATEVEEDILPPVATILAAKSVVYRDVTIANTRVLSEPEAVAAGNERLGRETGRQTYGPHPDLPAPRQMLLPVGDVFRHVFKMHLDTDEGPFDVWIDSENGDLLQYEGSRRAATVAVPECRMPRDFSTDDLCDYDWASATIDTPPAGSDYELAASGMIKGVVDRRFAEVTSPDDDFVEECTGDETDPADAECTTSGSEHDAIECFVYRSVLDLFQRFALFGAVPVMPLQLDVNAQFCNAYASYGKLEFGECSASASSCPAFTSAWQKSNLGWDPTIIGHEFGHRVCVRQADPTGSTGRHVRIPLQEGLGDYWGATYTATYQPDAVHEFDAEDRVVLSRLSPYACRAHYTLLGQAPVQDGGACRAADPSDQFEDRVFGECHADGNIIHWAVVSARDELVRRVPALPLLGLMFDLTLIDALQVHGITTTCGCDACTNLQVHEAYVELLDDLAAAMAADSLLVGHVNQMQSGFARANLFSTARDAVVNITRDDPQQFGTPPSFEIWSGRPYTFDSAGAVNTASPPFNSEYRLTVGVDPDFSGPTVDSGWLAMSGFGSTQDQECPDQPDGNCIVFTLTAAEWSVVNDGDRVYYRVQTRSPGDPQSVRSSGDLDGATLTPPFAYITSAGPICGCGSASMVGGGNARLAFVLTLALPLALVLSVRHRWRRREGTRPRRG